MPSNRLILCRPLLLLPPIFPTIRVFSDESVLCIRRPKYWSFSFSIGPSSDHPGLISFRMDWLAALPSAKRFRGALSVALPLCQCWEGRGQQGGRRGRAEGKREGSGTASSGDIRAEGNWAFLPLSRVLGRLHRQDGHREGTPRSLQGSRVRGRGAPPPESGSRGLTGGGPGSPSSHRASQPCPRAPCVHACPWR